MKQSNDDRRRTQTFGARKARYHTLHNRDDAEAQAEHCGDVHRRLGGTEHKNVQSFPAGVERGITHTIDDHRVDTLSLRLDGTSDGARQAVCRVEFALDRRWAGGDVSMAEPHPIAL